MTSDRPQTTSRFSKRQRILVVAVCFLVFPAGIAITLLHRYWPFDQKDIIEILQETVPGTKVTVAGFHRTYFIHPGCQAEGLTFVRKAIRPALPPLVTIQKLTIQANYADLFLRPGHISRILIDGLHIQVPLQGSSAAFENSSLTNTSHAKRTVVEQIASSAAVVEIGRREGSPLRFEIHEIKLGSVGLSQAMSYHVRLQNPLPPGEIEATGKLGPWNSQDIGQLPVSGTYRLDQANLGIFSGIQGILSSTGHFDGKLGHIAVAGDSAIPDFAVKAKSHSLPLKSRFEATVNGTNGDVRLTQVDVLLQSTPIQVQGSILGKSGAAGKITSLELIATRGRVQDILRPFVKALFPPMSGPINFRAQVTFHSDQRPFLKAVNLRGNFSITEGRFTAPDTQQSVESLSARARGIKNTSDKPAETVDPTLNASVSLSGGVAKFSEVSLEIPGARALMNGTFNVLNEKVDFHGTLKTAVELSDTTHGIKSILLKPLDPLFKRKHGGAAIPVEMTGTYSQPHFGMEIIPKHSPPSGSEGAKSIKQASKSSSDHR